MRDHMVPGLPPGEALIAVTTSSKMQATGSNPRLWSSYFPGVARPADESDVSRPGAIC
ncbi:MAG: hypothetical protein AB1563_06555 [Bacillota bacterium]